MATLERDLGKRSLVRLAGVEMALATDFGRRKASGTSNSMDGSQLGSEYFVSIMGSSLSKLASFPADTGRDVVRSRVALSPVLPNWALTSILRLLLLLRGHIRR